MLDQGKTAQKSPSLIKINLAAKGIVAKTLKVCPATLRIWERKDLIKPTRLGKNRFYSRCDMDRLEYINELIQIRRKNIGFIFQQFYLIPTLTARENVELPLIFAKKKIDDEKVSILLEEVGLKGKERIQAKHLSGGDKQRLGIARALINEPKLLLADEPTGKLETKVRDQLLELFEKLSKNGLAIFIATHDLELACATQRIIYLQDGKIVSKEESTLYYYEKKINFV